VIGSCLPLDSHNANTHHTVRDVLTMQSVPSYHASACLCVWGCAGASLIFAPSVLVVDQDLWGKWLTMCHAIDVKFTVYINLLTHCRPGKTLNSAAGLPARVQIPVPPSATSRLIYELLCGVHLGFLVVFPFRIACVFLHVERGRSSKRVWRSPQIIFFYLHCQ
jgi:hypothetical protein